MVTTAKGARTKHWDRQLAWPAQRHIKSSNARKHSARVSLHAETTLISFTWAYQHQGNCKSASALLCAVQRRHCRGGTAAIRTTTGSSHSNRRASGRNARGSHHACLWQALCKSGSHLQMRCKKICVSGSGLWSQADNTECDDCALCGAFTCKCGMRWSFDSRVVVESGVLHRLVVSARDRTSVTCMRAV